MISGQLTGKIGFRTSLLQRLILRVEVYHSLGNHWRDAKQDDVARLNIDHDLAPEKIRDYSYGC